MAAQGILISIAEDQDGKSPRVLTEDGGLPVGDDPAAFDRTIANFDAAFETSQAGTTGLGVFVQDQTTPALIIKANKVVQQTTLAVTAVQDAYTVTLTDATGFTTSNSIILTSATGNRYFFADIIGVAGNVITLDSPIDYAFESGQLVSSVVTNMAVNGSTTPEVFGLRGAEPPSGIDLVVDVTRLIFTMKTDSPVSLATFGNLTRLTRGFLVRHVNGVKNKVFNVKDNAEIAQLMYDFTVYEATNPSQGQDGLVARLTFGGQSKIGVVIRVASLEDLHFIIQDNLSGLQLFEIIIEGHVVQ